MVDDPAGVASEFSWNFGDPGAAGNQITTSTPSATHSYINPGTYTVTCSVSTSTPCNATGRGPSMLSAPVTVPICGKSGSGGPGGGSSHKFGCDILLYIALVLIALSGILGVIGCILYKVGNAQVAIVLGIIAAGLLTIGLALLGLWWFLCRFFTACQALLDALDFAGVMIAVFGVIAAVLAIIAGFANPIFWLCVGASFFNSALWGLLLYFLYKVAEAVGCLIPNPTGGPPSPSPSPPPPTSSSSGLGSSGGAAFPPAGPRQLAGPLRSEAAPQPRGEPAAARGGLGDAIMRATSAIGIQPCAGCLDRAARLNAWSARRASGTPP
jgi:PKD repeat protein